MNAPNLHCYSLNGESLKTLMAETEATINLSSFIETLNEVNSQIQRVLWYVLTMKTDVIFPLPGVFDRLELF